MSLIVAGRPTNLHPPLGATAYEYSGDVYMVCDRIKEKWGDRLYVVVMDDGSNYNFTVMERCIDGEDRMVKKYKELTPAILQDIDFMLRIDLKQRIRILEKENEKWEKDWAEAAAERQYEEIGRPMWTELERAGFIQRPVSYPKAGVTGGKGSRAKSLPRNLILP